MTKALVSVPAAMLVLICAMVLMTDTAAAATKYQVASPFMLQGAYRADYGQDGNDRVALAGGYYWTEWGGNPAASKLYYSKTEDGAGTLIGKTANTDSLIRNLDARILTTALKFITQWKAEKAELRKQAARPVSTAAASMAAKQSRSKRSVKKQVMGRSNWSISTAASCITE